jgi:hypothetical protein
MNLSAAQNVANYLRKKAVLSYMRNFMATKTTSVHTAEGLLEGSHILGSMKKFIGMKGLSVVPNVAKHLYRRQHWRSISGPTTELICQQHLYLGTRAVLNSKQSGGDIQGD